LSDNVKKEIEKSLFGFTTYVLPVISKFELLGGEIITIEDMTIGDNRDVFWPMFDMFSCVDAWQIETKKKYVRAISNRVQWGSNDWKSFTIRKGRASGADTEYQKLKRYLEEGDKLCPHLMIQSYITAENNGRLLSLGIAKVADIIRGIDDGWVLRTMINPKDKTKFDPIFWKRLVKEGRWFRGYCSRLCKQCGCFYDVIRIQDRVVRADCNCAKQSTAQIAR